jgi:hypothetical protein
MLPIKNLSLPEHLFANVTAKHLLKKALYVTPMRRVFEQRDPAFSPWKI